MEAEATATAAAAPPTTYFQFEKDAPNFFGVHSTRMSFWNLNYFSFCTNCGDYLLSPPTSMTRFGEISPLWQKFTILWAMFGMVYLVFDKLLYLHLQFLCYWSNFHCRKWTKIEK